MALPFKRKFRRRKRKEERQVNHRFALAPDLSSSTRDYGGGTNYMTCDLPREWEKSCWLKNQGGAAEPPVISRKGVSIWQSRKRKNR